MPDSQLCYLNRILLLTKGSSLLGHRHVLRYLHRRRGDTVRCRCGAYPRSPEGARAAAVEGAEAVEAGAEAVEDTRTS